MELDFNGEEFIQFLLDEGHSIEDIEEFLNEDFQDLLDLMLNEGLTKSEYRNLAAEHGFAKRGARNDASTSARFALGGALVGAGAMGATGRPGLGAAIGGGLAGTHAAVAAGKAVYHAWREKANRRKAERIKEEKLQEGIGRTLDKLTGSHFQKRRIHKNVEKTISRELSDHIAMKKVVPSYMHRDLDKGFAQRSYEVAKRSPKFKKAMPHGATSVSWNEETEQVDEAIGSPASIASLLSKKRRKNVMDPRTKRNKKAWDMAFGPKKDKRTDLEKLLDKASEHAKKLTKEETELDEAKRMSEMLPKELLQRGLDHAEGEYYSNNSHRGNQHSKAIDIIKKHLDSEHGAKSGKAFKVAIKHSTYTSPKTGNFNGTLQYDLERAVTEYSKKRLGEYVPKNAKGKIKEEFDGLDIEGLTEELLMEIKMKLKPGQKMTPKQFAKMKADVLAKQKEKAVKKAQPKPEKKEEKVESDDNNRNARILKGQFPWGNVNQELAKSAVSKLKQIKKPADRLKALDKIWANRKHFAALASGNLDLSDAPAKKKIGDGKVSLVKITGVND